MPGAGASGLFFERCKKCDMLIYHSNIIHELCTWCHSLLSCDECKKYLEPFLIQKRFSGTLLGSMYIGTDLWSVITRIIPVIYNGLNFDFVYPGLYWREKHPNVLSKKCNKPSKNKFQKKCKYHR